MMASETRICTVWTSLTISANTKCKQNSYKLLKSGIPMNAQNLRFRGILGSVAGVR